MYFTKEFFGSEQVLGWIEELNATEIAHNFTLEPGVWMAPVVLKNKDGLTMLGRRIHFDRMLNFYVTDMFEGLAVGHYSWQCGICHKFFFCCFNLLIAFGFFAKLFVACRDSLMENPVKCLHAVPEILICGCFAVFY